MQKIKLLLLGGFIVGFLMGCGDNIAPVAGESVESVQTSLATEESLELVQMPAIMEEVAEQSVVMNTQACLSVPTYITRIEELYFIVDCYHDQVIYHDNLEDPLTDWKVMTADVNRPHTIASDGVYYLVDDTENNRVLVMRKALNADGEVVFVRTQEFAEIGSRPHYIVYHEETKTFYVWSSMTGEMYLFKRGSQGNQIELAEVRRIEKLDGVYVRSFTIMDEDIYFVSGNCSIIQAKLDSFEVVEEYPVVSEIGGMIQMTKIQDFYYITVSTDVYGNQDYATLLRTRDLDKLKKGKYEIVYDYFIGNGTPYNITQIDGVWYMTEHRIPGVGVWSFDIVDNEIVNTKVIY